MGWWGKGGKRLHRQWKGHKERNANFLSGVCNWDIRIDTVGGKKKLCEKKVIDQYVIERNVPLLSGVSFLTFDRRFADHCRSNRHFRDVS